MVSKSALQLRCYTRLHASPDSKDRETLARALQPHFVPLEVAQRSGEALVHEAHLHHHWLVTRCGQIAAVFARSC